MVSVMESPHSIELPGRLKDTAPLPKAIALIVYLISLKEALTTWSSVMPERTKMAESPMVLFALGR